MNKIKVEVYKGNSDSNLPRNLEDCVSFIKNKLDLIPEEFRSSANIEFYSDFCGDSVDIDFCIYYFRPKTDLELNADAEQQKIRLEEARLFKIEQFKKLQRELGALSLWKKNVSKSS